MAPAEVRAKFCGESAMAFERHSVRVNRQRGGHERLEDDERSQVTEMTRGRGSGLMARHEARLRRQRLSAVFSPRR